MKNLAKIFSDEISKTTSLKNRGTIQLKNDDVYILHHATVPAIMVEAGYLSNLDDLEYIKSEEGQAAIAEGIYNSIMRAYKEYMSFEKVEE
jgi:N-acetylmuramoyl-L-alanine amidase